MAVSVKREVPVSGKGQARTRLARRAVIDAARSLFVERGYAATTIDAVSATADVPPATVYRLFASKVGILKAVLDTSIAGDDEPVAVKERPDVAVRFAHTDPHELIAAFADLTATINQRTSDIYRVLVDAANADAETTSLLDAMRDQRARGQRGIAHALAKLRALRPGLRERDAADLIHALMSPEIYRLLVVDRRWKPSRYQQWLTETLAQQLM